MVRFERTGNSRLLLPEAGRLFLMEQIQNRNDSRTHGQIIQIGTI